MFWELKRRVAKGIPVYQQSPLQDDVWAALRADKDDFLVYDRCGRLTFHIVLPYSFLHYPFIEAAIRATYNKDICGNCSVDSNSMLSAQWNNTQYNDTGLVASNGNKTDSSPIKRGNRGARRDAPARGGHHTHPTHA
uniref:Selenoprotein P N-terminal domain-containing protein n=1 Tax=Anguilla anguilla TaxID=7936 RepID=A0A0E9XV37_ANGAN